MRRVKMIMIYVLTVGAGQHAPNQAEKINDITTACIKIALDNTASWPLTSNNTMHIDLHIETHI